MPHNTLETVVVEMRKKVAQHGMPNYLINEIYDWANRLEAAQPAGEARDAARITADWVIGYLPSDCEQSLKDSINDAFQEFAALTQEQPNG